MRRGIVALTAVAAIALMTGCVSKNVNTPSQDNKTEKVETEKATESLKQADFKSINGYWYIDGDSMLASIHIEEDGSYESFYASGNSEHTGNIRYEWDDKLSDYCYCLYTTEGQFHLKFVDDGSKKKNSFVTTDGVIFKCLYEEGGSGDDGPGYVDTVGETLAGSWSCGNFSIDIANMGEGIFYAKVVKNNDNGIFTEWTYQLIHDTKKLVADKKGIKADVSWTDGSSTVAYTDGTATFELKDGKLIWNDSMEDAGKNLEFIKE